MHRMSSRLLPAAVLLALLGISLQQISAQSRSGAGAYQVALPLVAAAGAPPAPGPGPVGGGFFGLTDSLTYNAATAVDPQGIVHLAFYVSDERSAEPLGQPVFYTTCAAGVAACGDPQRWGGIVQIDSAVNEVQIAVTSDGRPRLLVRVNGAVGYDYHYWECDQQCASGDRWAGALVTDAAGVELRSADLPQRSFALDGQGRPRFVYGNGWGNQHSHGVYYVACDAACASPESWRQTLVETRPDKTVSADYAALAFDGDRPRFLTRVTASGLPDRLALFTCDQGCDDPQGWASTTIGHPAGQQWDSWDLAIAPDGGPRIALYDAPAPDIFVGGALFYGWCAGACAGPGAPVEIVQVATGEGMNVDLAIDPQGRTHMVYDAGQRGAVGQLWCDVGCASTGAWRRRILETSAELMAEFAPASPLTCDQQERAWLDAIPAVAFGPAGELVVAYDIKHVAICYYQDPTNPSQPPGTRVERVWWAVRWATFTR